MIPESTHSSVEPLTSMTPIAGAIEAGVDAEDAEGSRHVAIVPLRVREAASASGFVLRCKAAQALKQSDRSPARAFEGALEFPAQSWGRRAQRALRC